MGWKIDNFEIVTNGDNCKLQGKYYWERVKSRGVKFEIFTTHSGEREWRQARGPGYGKGRMLE